MKDLNALRDDLMELKPTLFAGVPRVFEKVHEGKFTHQQKIYILFEFSIKLIKDHLFLSGIKKAVEELNPVRRRVFGMLYKQ